MMIRMKDIVRPLAPFKSMVKRGSQAICMEISYGPTFGGGHGICVANNAAHIAHSYTNFGHSFLAPSEVKEKVTVLAGTYHFTPNEVEVFFISLRARITIAGLFLFLSQVFELTFSLPTKEC